MRDARRVRTLNLSFILFCVIGLYSRLGRQDLQPARALIAEHQLMSQVQPSVMPAGEGQADANRTMAIRRFRQLIQQLPQSHPASSVSTSPDFYTMSQLRYATKTRSLAIALSHTNPFALAAAHTHCTHTAHTLHTHCTHTAGICFSIRRRSSWTYRSSRR
jgi:hypothetical protein